jgi:phosphoribosylformimino-5-aminoimidazole carboxamide ribotide isomerase
VAGWAIEPGDARALASTYVERVGITELYAADLDAILGGASQDALVARLATLGVPLWLDAAVSSADHARRALALGAAQVVVGLETLASYGALEEISGAVGGERIAFSLDLRDGVPIVAAGSSGMGAETPASEIAARAAGAGAGTVIVLDLARVGTAKGIDLALIARVRAVAPGVVLLAGGGIRGLDDLARLSAVGCDGALVATALHDGRLSAADVAVAVRMRDGAGFAHGRPTR